MTTEIYIVLTVLVLAVILFVTEKLPVDLVALIVMGLLLISGIITPAQGLSGFANAATVTIGAMFVLSAGLFKTGAVNFLGELVTNVFKRGFWVGILTVMVVVGVLSAFINNTPVIAIFLPILLSAARETGISASKILMPASFASMFGGVCTLIGTSTNILVSSIAEAEGLRPFAMFEFTPLGIIFFIGGTIYLLVIGIRLIPDRRGKGDLIDTFSLHEYLAEVILLPDAPSVGYKIKDAPLVADLDLSILKIKRGDTVIQLPTADDVLEANDVMLIRCNIDEIRTLQEREGVALKPHAKWGDEGLTSDDYRLIEAIIEPNSSLVGSTLTRSRFRERYGATVLAIRHRGRLLREKLSQSILGPGDLLLLEVKKDRVAGIRTSGEFIVTSEMEMAEFRRNKALIAVAIVVGVVLAATLNLAPIVVAALLGAIAIILAGCISVEEAYEAIEWKIIFLLAGVLSLGAALNASGAARLLSDNMIGYVGAWGLVALVSAFYLLTSLLTEAMSNNATAALLAPIAIASAQTLGVSPTPFLMAITFAASASFMTPVGYQTNTMIYEPGQYKFTDFIRVGAPLNVMFWILATLLIPVFWPF